MNFIKRAEVKVKHMDNKSYLIHIKSDEVLWESNGYDCLRDMWMKYNRKVENEAIS